MMNQFRVERNEYGQMYIFLRPTLGLETCVCFRQLNRHNWRYE